MAERNSRSAVIRIVAPLRAFAWIFAVQFTHDVL